MDQHESSVPISPPQAKHAHTLFIALCVLNAFLFGIGGYQLGSIKGMQQGKEALSHTAGTPQKKICQELFHQRLTLSHHVIATHSHIPFP